MSEFKNNIFNKMNLSNAQTILDLGCGHGKQLMDLYKLKDNNIQLFGIDKIEKSIKISEEKTKNIDEITIKKHDVTEGIPFDDNFIDIAFSINMLECIPDKHSLLEEIHRVLKLEGQIVMAHYDFDTQLFDGTDKKLVRKIVTSYSDWEQNWMDASDSWMGRRLWSVINGSGLFHGEVDAYVLTETKYTKNSYGYNMVKAFQGMVSKEMITEEEYKKFKNDIEKLSDEDRYFYSLNMYVYTGKKVS